MEDAVTYPPPGSDLNASQLNAPKAEGAVSAPAAPPAIPSETIYVQNLNEKIKIDVMQQTLRALFKNYGNVLDVVAHRNIRMRGQAFVSFESIDVASQAVKEVKGFPLYGKPMQVSFAKTRSDAVVKEKEPGHFDAHKVERLERKRKGRWNNPHKKKARAKRAAALGDGAAPSTAPRRPIVQMPDEYLPPNKILFLQSLPQDVTQDALIQLFSQYPNLVEVRMIPTKKDIAFVEYTDEGSAGVAKDALHNYKLDGEHKIKITFARK
jgi:RNA recognition motif-containing protein